MTAPAVVRAAAPGVLISSFMLGRGPFAAVILGHRCHDGSPTLSRKEFLDKAMVLAGSGVVSLLIDGPIIRPGSGRARPAR
jgi:hypothetical protein